MAREDYLLVPGDEIACDNGEIYTIDQVIGSGGTSVIYSCKEDNSVVNFAIKECFPREGYIREGANIVPDSSDERKIIQLEDEFDYLCDSFKDELQVSQNIANQVDSSNIINKSLSIKRIYHLGKSYKNYNGAMLLLNDTREQGLFLNQVLKECEKNKNYSFPLRNNGMPLFHITKEIVKNVLVAIDNIHNAGYLHLDIQTGNIFMRGCNVESIHTFNDLRYYLGNGTMIDYASSKKLIDGKTEPIHKIYATKGFGAPELYNDHPELTKAADIYSIGVLLYYLISGDEQIENYEKEIPYNKLSISLPQLRRIGFNVEYREQLKYILKKALNTDPEERYQNCKEMMKDLEDLDKMILIQGREDDCIKIMDATKPIVVYGKPGNGKTTLAKFLSTKYNLPYIYFDAYQNWDDLFTGKLFKAVTHGDSIPLNKDQAKNELKGNDNLPIVFIDACTTLKEEIIDQIARDYPHAVILCDNEKINTSIKTYELKEIHFDSKELERFSNNMEPNTMAVIVSKDLATKMHTDYDYNTLLDAFNKSSVTGTFGKLFQLCHFNEISLFQLITEIIFPSVQANSLLFKEDKLPSHKKMLNFHWASRYGQEINVHINLIQAIYEVIKSKGRENIQDAEWLGKMIKYCIKENTYDHHIITKISDYLVYGNQEMLVDPSQESAIKKTINVKNTELYSTNRGGDRAVRANKELDRLQLQLASLYEKQNRYDDARKVYVENMDRHLNELVNNHRNDGYFLCLLSDFYQNIDQDTAKELLEVAADSGYQEAIEKLKLLN